VRLTGGWSATSEAERTSSVAALEQRRRREALPLAWRAPRGPAAARQPGGRGRGGSGWFVNGEVAAMVGGEAESGCSGHREKGQTHQGGGVAA
jgi:hypothetical protein